MQNGTLEIGCNLFFFTFFFKKKVLMWNVERDLSVSQISMLTVWVLNHALKLVPIDQAQKSGKDGWTKAVGE